MTKVPRTPIRHADPIGERETQRPPVELMLRTLPTQRREIIDATPDALRVIELDDSRNDRFQAVADSYAWLAAEGLV